MMRLEVMSINLTDDDQIKIGPANRPSLILLGVAAKRLEQLIRSKLSETQQWSSAIVIVRRTDP